MRGREGVAQITLKDLVEAGVHFGHRVSRWNPKMRPFIYGKRGAIHIIDPRETLRGLLRAAKYLKQVVPRGSLILFVGTKRQARDIIAQAAQRCGMPYVTERWLGGTLTNLHTIRSRLRRLEELERLINSDDLKTYSKKMIASILREHRKMHRNLHGIRILNRLPEALILVDPVREHNAVAEANKLDIKVIALIDTDGDPDVVDLPIPGNDDSMRSIAVVINYLADVIVEAQASLPPEYREKLAAGGQPAVEATTAAPASRPVSSPARQAVLVEEEER
jgi:small subunit ribosomal protein S2